MSINELLVEKENLKKYKELEYYLDKIKNQKVMIPSEKNTYMEEFKNKLAGKILNHYYAFFNDNSNDNKNNNNNNDKNKNLNWYLNSNEFLVDILLSSRGSLNKIRGIELFLLDTSIFIPLTEKKILDIGKKFYTYSNSPKYLNENKGIFFEIPYKTHREYHFLEIYKP
ncbi:MAG: hypothetical protein QXK76_01220 [Candidatus Woesearchaeota archaeon]